MAIKQKFEDMVNGDLLSHDLEKYNICFSHVDRELLSTLMAQDMQNHQDELQATLELEKKDDLKEEVELIMASQRNEIASLMNTGR